jgi:signal transduction histidine kinase
MQEKMSSILIGNQRQTIKILDNKLKHIDVLKESLMPFLLIIDFNGTILSAGSAINKIAKKNIENQHIDNVIKFINPSSFEKLKNLNTNTLIKYNLIDSDIYIKASNHLYKREKAIFINGVPIINSKYPLSNSNLNLNDFSETTVMAEYLFLIESNKRGMSEAYQLIENVKGKNKNLENAFNEIENISRFPSENPHPVLRLSLDGIILFANDAANENLLQPFNLNIGDEIGNDFNFLLNITHSSNKPIERILEFNNKTFSTSYVKITNRDYINVYAVDITNSKNEIQKREKELEIVKDTLVKLNENLESKVAEGIEVNKKLQNEVFQQDKLVTLGELSAGVAHDLNTPLGAIQASSENIRSTLEKFFKEDMANLDKEHVYYACELATRKEFDTFISSREERKRNKALQQFLQDNYLDKYNNYIVAKILTNAQISHDDKEIISKILNDKNPNEFLNVVNSISQIRKSIDTILSAVEKSSDVIKTLKDYVYRDDSYEISDINLLESINNVLTLFNNEIKKGVDIEINIDKDFHVKGSLMRLNQVWTNLIKNAIQAMKNNGTLEIKSELIDNQKYIHFINNGPIIKEKDLDKIFEPFFTTKKRKEGTGMGLSIVTRIIKDHRASIEVKSNKDNTCFTIIFK